MVLLASGKEGALDRALLGLQQVVADHHLRLIVVWPGSGPPRDLGVRLDGMDLVVVPQGATAAESRRAGAGRVAADLLMFADEDTAIEAGWGDIVALRLGLIRRGSSNADGDDWVSILSEQGVPDSAHGA